MDTLEKQLQILATYLSPEEVYNEKVSAAGSYWHIQHTLLTIEKIFESLSQSDPKAYSPSFSLSKVFVFSTGNIPRGRAQSPASVRPTERATFEQLHHELQKVRSLLPAFISLPPHAYFNHPVLGLLTTREAMRFLAIHTRHHNKILRDIVRTSLK